jgi:hypothetical protein
VTSPSHPEHGVEDLCPAGTDVYERALREGSVHREDAYAAPCLVDHGLLHPAVEDPRLLEPVAPAVVLHRLLRTSGARIADERRREERLAETFERLMRVDGRRTGPADTAPISVLNGFDRINSAIAEVMSTASQEVLAIQPRRRNPESLDLSLDALRQDQTLLDRGGRIRTLYPHALRHQSAVLTRYEQRRPARWTRSPTASSSSTARSPSSPRAPTAPSHSKSATRP